MSINKTNFGCPIISDEIVIEWDIRSANTSLIKHYQLLPQEEVEKYESLDGIERKIAIGNKQKEDRTFSRDLEKAFDEIIEEFILVNGLDFDKDIVAIKKDAIFIRMSRFLSLSERTSFPNITSCEALVTKFGPHVNFIPKNVYNYAIMLSNLYEFYYNSKTQIIDVKGISDDSINLHDNGIIQLIVDVMEKSMYDKKVVLGYLSKFILGYKKKRLILDVYREFNSESKYKIVYDADNIMKMDIIDTDLLEYTDISFNYINIILPLVAITL